MVSQRKVRIAVNRYGVIGKRVADAIALQRDMSLVGISDVAIDWRMRIVTHKGLARPKSMSGPWSRLACGWLER
jgi:glyceraldehyde-3-phosphate dehydrogenase (NAD(P))